MNNEFLYFSLMVAGWVFLGGWAVALVTACAMAFRNDSVRQPGRPARSS